MNKRSVNTFRIAGYALIGYLFIYAGRAGIETTRWGSKASSSVAASGEILDSPAQVYAVSPTILAVDIAAPTVSVGRQVPYVPEASDTVRNRQGHQFVRRAGTSLGLLIGENSDILYTDDQVSASTFRLRQAENPERYVLTSQGDANYAIAQSPQQVFRKSKPMAMARRATGDRQWPADHTLFLTLSEPLESGQSYQLNFPGLGIAPTAFDYDPMATRSEAVQVSQLGFRPDDPTKVAFLSTWMGSGGGLDYPQGLSFQVIDTQRNQAVYEGSATQRRGLRQQEDARKRDYTLSEVHQLDFSSVTQPGEYRVCVATVGCSFEFEIGESVWTKAFKTAARGFYHQRSGIAIGAPFSEFERPRAFHPDDGLTIYSSSATLLETKMGLGKADAFETLLAGKTDEAIEGVWGGYFDAGDWDRRIQHLMVTRRLLELHDLFPQQMGAIALNLPESNNALPDIIDEALWSLDFFRQLQTPEGGIRGGIESAAHPKRGEASWQESLTVMAYAPDVWSSYVYAGVAARAAETLKAYDPQLAATYTDSALQAMAYAEANYVDSDFRDGTRLHRVPDERNLAALELYRLTGESPWHDLFLSTSAFRTAEMGAVVGGSHDQMEAAFLYAHLDQMGGRAQQPPQQNQAQQNQAKQNQAQQNQAQQDDKQQNKAGKADQGLSVDEGVRSRAKAAFLSEVDKLVTLTETTGFGWSKPRAEVPLGWRNGLGAPSASVDILRAHTLSNDDKYLQAGLMAAQFSAGANPDNMVFTTGLGDRSPQHPLIVDQRITGQSPPPGITLFGPTDFGFHQDYWTVDAIASDTFPHPEEWPSVENYFDIYSYPMGAEFTVDYMVSAAYTWGYLAAR